MGRGEFLYKEQTTQLVNFGIEKATFEYMKADLNPFVNKN